jgi:hypothetical protein
MTDTKPKPLEKRDVDLQFDSDGNLRIEGVTNIRSAVAWVERYLGDDGFLLFYKEQKGKKIFDEWLEYNDDAEKASEWNRWILRKAFAAVLEVKSADVSLGFNRSKTGGKPK